MDPFAEAAAELGCDVDEIEGTFPGTFVDRIRRNNERAQWRRVVINAYNELTARYVERDFPEPTLAILYEDGQDETTAVRNLVQQSGKPCSIHDAMGAVDNAMRKIGIA